ncbi:MAG: chromate transporter [Eubacteriales bacterium]|nr:chromate transporter [Eubacteriales bacterium]
MKELWNLFAMFFRIGGLTFGGGYAMLPMLQKELVEDRQLLTTEEIMDYYAIGQCTPGIIAVNTATFVGYKLKGVPGAIIATLGVVAPSLVIITVIAAFIKNFASYPAVQHALAGIRVAVAALVTNAVIKLWKSGVKDWIGIVLCVLGCGLSLFTSISPIFVVIGAALVGIAVQSMKQRRQKKGGTEA